MEAEINHQPKPDRSRTRWTLSLDKIFSDLVVEQIQLGNRPNDIFDKKTWNHIRDEFNKQTDLNFNNNQLRKHLDVLRTRFNNLKSAFVPNDFPIDHPCFNRFDIWDGIGVQVQVRPETTKVKDCPIYDQLCAIFTDTSADGKYAQSSHFDEGIEKSLGHDTVSLNSTLEGETTRSGFFTLQKEKVAKNMIERKRKRAELQSSQTAMNQETIDAMGKAMMEIVAASKLRTVAPEQKNDRFCISNCIKALDEITSLGDKLYFAALDLFEDPCLRETFISLQGNMIRFAWLQRKVEKIGY